MVTFILISTISNSQTKVDNLFKKESYSEVIKLLKEKERKTILNLNESQLMALALYYNSNYTAAYDYFSRVINENDFLSKNNFFYAHCLKAIDKDSLANKYLQDYYKENKIDYLSRIEDYETLKKLGNRYNINNLEKLNSKFSDIFGSKYGDNIYFSSTRNTTIDGEKFKWNNQPFLDIFIMKKDSTVNNFRSLNTDNHESDCSINRVNGDFYFTSSKADPNIFLKKDQVISTKIFKAKYNNTNVEEIILLPFNSEVYSCKNPFVDYKNKRLYFSSNKPGGFGGFDIYYTDFYNPEVIVNLGSEINTFGDEEDYFMDDENNIYFTSNAYIGFGGKDVYTRIFDSSTQVYKRVMNVGMPLNSKYDDFGYQLTSKKEGFFTSNRKPNIGDDDIYSFTITKPLELDKVIQDLTIIILDSKTKSPISNAKVKLKLQDELILDLVTNSKGEAFGSIEGNKKYAIEASAFMFNDKIDYLDTSSKKFDKVTKIINLDAAACVEKIKGIVRNKNTQAPIENAKIIIQDSKGELITSVLTNNLGEYETLVPCGKIIFLRVNKEESNDPIFAEHQEYMEIGNSYMKENNKNIDLIPVKSRGLISNKDGQILIPTKPIYFAYNKADLNKVSYSELDKVVKFLKENPEWLLEVNSHSDIRGTDEYNLNLSNKRAESTKNYMVKQGIAAERIKATGYGESVPIIDCVKKECNENEHSINRRSEFVIIF